VLALALFAAALPASDYAGAAACRSCHQTEFESQSATGHAKSLSRSRPGQPGDWAFGAGTQAITFVSRLDRENYLEHGESWFTRLDHFGPTPGHRAPGGVRYRIFDPAAGILRCFSCHSTGGVSLDAEGAIQPAELGVRCEDCHGPSAGHAAEPEKVRAMNPARLSAAQISDLCGACHRMAMGATASPRLSDPWNARHQPLMLAASSCFAGSKGGLSCLSCHRPHIGVERHPSAYDGACRRCHPAQRHTVATAGRVCTECHMPAVKPVPGLSFANHRIAVYAPTDPLNPVRRR